MDRTGIFEEFDRGTGQTRYRREYVPQSELARVRRWIRRYRAASARGRIAPESCRCQWPRPAHLPHGELLPKREVLERQLAMCANRGPQRPNEDPKPSDHDWPIA